MRLATFLTLIGILLVILGGCGSLAPQGKTTDTVAEDGQTSAAAEKSKNAPKNSEKGPESTHGSENAVVPPPDPQVNEPPAKNTPAPAGNPLRIAHGGNPPVEQDQEPRFEIHVPGMHTASAALPTGDRATSLLLLRTLAPPKKRINQDYHYEIHVENVTNNVELADVRVSQGIPLGLQIRESEVVVLAKNGLETERRKPQAVLETGANRVGQIVWNFPSLNPGDTARIKVTARGSQPLPPARAKPQLRIAGHAALHSALRFDYRPLLEFSTEITEPEVELIKSIWIDNKNDPVSDVENCRRLTFKYVVKNTGNELYDGVVLREKLPKGLRTVDEKSEIVLNVGRLQPAADEPTVTEVEAVVFATRTGEFAGHAVLEDVEGYLDESKPVSVRLREGKLEIVHVAGHKEQDLGQEMDYTVTVKNAGDAPAPQSRLAAVLGKGAMVVGSQPPRKMGAEHWQLGTIQAGGSKTVTVTVKTTLAGPLVNLFTAAFGGEPHQTSMPAMTETDIKPQLGLRMVVISSTDEEAALGEDVRCSIQVINDGPAPDGKIRVSVTLPEHVNFVSASGRTPGAVNKPERTITFAPVQLEPGGKAIWRVQVQAAHFGEGAFSAVLSSAALGPQKVKAASEPLIVNALREPVAAP